MGFVAKTFLVVGVAFVAYMMDFLIQLNYFGRVYKQHPGQCHVHKMNGSEDIILLPNNDAIISSGLRFYVYETQSGPPQGMLYYLDMSNSLNSPIPLEFENDYLRNNPDFNPHGISYWEDENGVILLYVICHWRNGDSVEVFRMNKQTMSVKYEKSIRHDILINMNNLIVIGKDEFYATQWQYFTNHALQQLEIFLRLPLMSVLYYNGKTKVVLQAAKGLRSPNGINKSNNNKYIYVANTLGGEIIAYTRNEDNSLLQVETLSVPFSVDNISIDKKTGHLWVAVLSKSLELAHHYTNISHPVPSQILHFIINEDSPKPFTGIKVEQVFQSDSVAAISTSLYYNNTLFLGSVFGDMLVCDVHYLMY